MRYCYLLCPLRFIDGTSAEDLLHHKGAFYAHLGTKIQLFNSNFKIYKIKMSEE